MKVNHRLKSALIGAAASILMGGIAAPLFAQVGTAPNNAITRFDTGYLAQHPDVAQQLSANPALIDNRQYVTSHPGLQEYLEEHPTVRHDLRTHPRAFMNREDQLNGRREPYNPNGGPAARFSSGYLAQHPDVAQQLSANPALVDNRDYLNSHPGLKDYLAEHPQIRQDIKTHPYRFMRREDQLNGWRAPSHPGPLANTEEYFDQHPDVQKELQQNPRLIDNRQFVESHPELEEFLRNHPNAREQWQAHPYRYMHRENRWEHNH